MTDCESEITSSAQKTYTGSDHNKLKQINRYKYITSIFLRPCFYFSTRFSNNNSEPRICKNNSTTGISPEEGVSQGTFRFKKPQSSKYDGGNIEAFNCNNNFSRFQYLFFRGNSGNIRDRYNSGSMMESQSISGVTTTGPLISSSTQILTRSRSQRKRHVSQNSAYNESSCDEMIEEKSPKIIDNSNNSSPSNCRRKPSEVDCNFLKKVSNLSYLARKYFYDKSYQLCHTFFNNLLINYIQPGIKESVRMASQPAILYRDVPMIDMTNKRRLGQLRKKTLVLDLDETLIKCTQVDPNQLFNTTNRPNRFQPKTTNQVHNHNLSTTTNNNNKSGNYNGFNTSFLHNFSDKSDLQDQQSSKGQGRKNYNFLWNFYLYVNDIFEEFTLQKQLENNRTYELKKDFQKNSPASTHTKIRSQKQMEKENLIMQKLYYLSKIKNFVWILLTVLPIRIVQDSFHVICRTCQSLKSRTINKLKNYFPFSSSRIKEYVISKLYPVSHKEKSEFKLYLNVQQRAIPLNIVLRPHVRLFLRQVSKWYDVVIFTAAVESYANAVCNKLESMSGIEFQKRYFRQHWFGELYFFEFFFLIMFTERKIRNKPIIENL